MRRYEAYKDSGVEWIGEIPEGWQVMPIWVLATYNDEILSENTNPEYQFNYIDISSVSEGSIDSYSEQIFSSAPSRARRVVRRRDVLVSTVRTYLKAIALVDEEHAGYVASTGFCVLRPKADTNSRWFGYALSEESIIDEIVARSVGVSYPAINASDLVKLQLRCPPIEEQQAMADYLDAKTAEVDALVADCEREVGLLREYRKAVISEAVTKGIDPDAPMKDSGVEWIGEYPISWEYIKLGYTFDRLFDIDHWMPESTNEGYPYLMIGDLEELASRIDFKSCKHISEEDYLGLAVKGTPRRGDVIIARYATIGTGCFVDIDEHFIVTYACLTVTPKLESMRGRYLLYYTQSDAFARELFVLTNSNTQGNVGKDSLSKAHILLPPIEVQDEIISALDARTRIIDELIQYKQAMADKLREYRKSLISEAVTGKFKVPGVE